MVLTDKRGPHLAVNVFDIQPLLKGQNNNIGDQLWRYIKLNMIDMVVIRGISASEKSKAVNEKIQDSMQNAVGSNMIKYVTNPMILPGEL